MISAFYKKEVSLNFANHDLSFMVSQQLFSSTSVDLGTKRLLRSLIFHPLSYNKVLDLGCGYGPLGVALKASQPSTVVHFVDKDALALEFTKVNLQENGLNSETAVFASLGYQQVVDTDYDLIVSNIPAKVGSKVLKYLVEGAYNYLNKQGQVAVVVIDAITDEVEHFLEKDGIEVTYRHSWPGHTVFHYRFNADFNKQFQNQQEVEGIKIFLRDKVLFSGPSQDYELMTTYNLAEFNELNKATKLLVSKLNWLPKKLDRLAIVNPQQGYLPVVLATKLKLSELVLIDRDWQALLTSQHNLDQNNSGLDVQLRHQTSWEIGSPVLGLAGVVPAKQPLAVYKLWWQQITERIQLGGIAQLAADSTTITRMADMANDQGWVLKQRLKEHGYSVASWIKN